MQHGASSVCLFPSLTHSTCRDTWAKTTSPNKNVKIYIGAPAAPSAAGSGYVDVNTLGNIAKQTRSQYSSFGGVMLWDASQAYGGLHWPVFIKLACLMRNPGLAGNGRFDIAIKNAMGTGSGTTIITTPTTTPTSTPTTTPTTTPGSGSCAGVAAWTSTIAVSISR